MIEMDKSRLDQALAARRIVATRSQAEGYIRLGKVTVNGKIVTKAGFLVGDSDDIVISQALQYVSRAALKLESVTKALNLDFRGKTALDVGSSTGGFTDFVLRAGAERVIAVDVGTDQLHHSLRGDERIELYEKTDIRSLRSLNHTPDIVLIDVSFISIREILPHILKLAPKALILAMLKPQFEAGKDQVNSGIIKNDRLRRTILKDFEQWAKQQFNIVNKADSQVSGSKGNLERFYLLKSL